MLSSVRCYTSLLSQAFTYETIVSDTDILLIIEEYSMNCVGREFTFLNGDVSVVVGINSAPVSGVFYLDVIKH